MPHRRYHEGLRKKAEIIRVRIRDEHGKEEIYPHRNLPPGKFDFDEEYDVFSDDNNHILVVSRQKPEPITNYYKRINEEGKEECLVQKGTQITIIRMDGMGQIKHLFGQLEKFNKKGKRVLIIERRLKHSLETAVSSPAQ